jgi:hypothetical protein
VSVTAVEALTTEERRLVLALREIPDSPLRERFATLVRELSEFVASPSCAEMQADGAPCSSADASCEQCRKVEELLEGLRRRLQEG